MPFVRSLQKVILIGNVTKDPQLRYTANNNTPVLRFTVATNRVFVNSKGERKEESDFHRVVVWGAFAEKLSNILHKGDKVYIEGRLEYREIRDSEGKIIAVDARVRVDELIILARSKNRTQVGDNSATDEGAQQAVDLDSIAAELAGEAKESDSETTTTTEGDAGSEVPEEEKPEEEKPEEDLPF